MIVAFAPLAAADLQNGLVLGGIFVAGLFTLLLLAALAKLRRAAGFRPTCPART